MTLTEKTLEEKLRKHITRLYDLAERHSKTPEDVQRNEDLAFGALFFHLSVIAPNALLYEDDDTDICMWWDNEMLVKFKNLKESRRQ